MNGKKWSITVLIITFAGLLSCAVFNMVIDPFMHYRGGLSGLEYPLKDERYVNDGIQRYYDYKILITGTSMALNFSPSRVSELWGEDAIKTAYSGAFYHELADNMENAISHNPEIDTVICSLDPNNMVVGYDCSAYEGSPEYLYDNNPFNDVNYLLNKEVITKSVAVINYTRAGNTTVSLDDYGRFDLYMPSGREAVLASYERLPEIDSQIVFGDAEKEIVHDNITLNFLRVARDNPDVEFIFFVPPYSYCFWDAMSRTSQLEYVIDAEKYAVGLLLECDNVSVYAFDDDLDITTDLDNYTDTLHYTSDICNVIAERIYRGEGRLSVDDYLEYYDRIEKIYSEYDYDL